jgi:flavin-dependent dehydrogenase
MTPHDSILHRAVTLRPPMNTRTALDSALLAAETAARAGRRDDLAELLRHVRAFDRAANYLFPQEDAADDMSRACAEFTEAVHAVGDAMLMEIDAMRAQLDGGL